MKKLLMKKVVKIPNHRGFTLLELVIVITVLGILLVLGAAAYRGITESAQNTAIMNDIKVLEDAAELADAKGLTILGEAAGLSSSDNVRNQKGETVDPDDPDHILYTINAANVGQYIKRLKHPIEDYVIDSKKLVYYKGIFAGETVAAATPTATPTATATPEPYGYDNPEVPAGFTHTGGTWNTGFVIEDASGNEFVWVPSESPAVGGIKKHSEFHDPGATAFTYFWNGSSSSNMDCSGYSDADNIATVKSWIEAAGGFYIARYEMSNDGSSHAQSKPNVIPWGGIDWTTSRAVADSMKNDYSYDSSIDTHLIYGAEWDTAVYWLTATNAITSGQLSDSTSIGNFNNEVIETGQPGRTGIHNEYMKNNIYDLAGNQWEWTMEKDTVHTGQGSYSGQELRVFRGGTWMSNGNAYTIITRASNPVALTNTDFGFRTALCVH